MTTAMKFILGFIVFVNAIFAYNHVQADEYDNLPPIQYNMGTFIMISESTNKLFPSDETIKPRMAKIMESKKAGEISTQDAMRQMAEANLDHCRTVFGAVGYNFDKSLVNFAKLCQTYNSCVAFQRKIKHIDTSGGGIRLAIMLSHLTALLMADRNASQYLPRHLWNALAPLPISFTNRNYYSDENIAREPN